MCALLPPVRLPGDISIELLQDGEFFLGLGSIQVQETVLRNSRRPLFVEIRNPSGIELSHYSLIDRLDEPDRVLLKFAMKRKEGGLMEWMVHEVRPRYNTVDWSAAPRRAEDTSLELELRPVSREIGGRKYSGFSYQYRYRSDSIPIYKILDRATWEIGGSVFESEFWMRNCFVPPIVRLESAEQFYSTEWFLADCANPSPFQFLPLQTELQGFTFAASKAGVLVTWATQVAHIRSLFEKPRGEDLLVHLHEHCGDLGHELTTAPVEVLWAAGERTRVDWSNDYEAVRELVHEKLHAEIGMRRERVTTYGQIEEWSPANIDRYRELGLPKLIQSGAKTIYIANHFENNMNTWGVSNMCCTVDLKVAESVGSDKLRKFCQEAHAQHARVEMWGNTALSTLTLLFQKKGGVSDRIRFLPEADSILQAIDPETGFVRNPSNALEADHYTPSFAVLNLCDAKVRDYWLRRWQDAHDDIGLDGIFLDSSFNLSSDKFHYIQNTQAGGNGATADQLHLLGKFRPAQDPKQAILSQYQAHLTLMVEMQKRGYTYCNEDIGVFGIHRHGPGVTTRLDNLSLWADCICTFDVPALQAKDSDPDAVYFRGLAYRMMWSLYWDIQRDVVSFSYEGPRGDLDLPKPWHLELLHIYNRVESQMIGRTILPGEKGVLYRSGKTQVLWAFEDFRLPLERSRQVVDTHTGKSESVTELKAVRHGVYTIGDGE